MFFGILLLKLSSIHVCDYNFNYTNVLKRIKCFLKSFAKRIKKSFNVGLWAFSFPDDTWEKVWKQSVPLFKKDHYTIAIVFYFLPEVFSALEVNILYVNHTFIQCIYFFVCKELVAHSFPASKPKWKVSN